MASPPPTGPQSPPPSPLAPPPYPPQGYPPQGYPPQYPQQPYYGPQRPPPPKSNTALLIVVIVVVFVAVLAIVAYFVVVAMLAPAQQYTRVTITGVSFTLSGSASSFFGTSPVTSCSNCPITAFVGTGFTYSMTLTNTDTSASHRVNAVTVTSPFTLTSTAPSLPATVLAGGSISLTLTIQASTVGGSYILTGSVTLS